MKSQSSDEEEEKRNFDKQASADPQVQLVGSNPSASRGESKNDGRASGGLGIASAASVGNETRESREPSTTGGSKKKPSAASARKKRPPPAASSGSARSAAVYVPPGYGGNTVTTARGRTSFVGRRKGFIDDSEIPENETPEEKKRRLNRNNERRKRARRVFKIDYLSERKQELTDKNDGIRLDNQTMKNQIQALKEMIRNPGSAAAAASLAASVAMQLQSGPAQLASRSTSANTSAARSSPSINASAPEASFSQEDQTGTTTVTASPDSLSLGPLSTMAGRDSSTGATGNGQGPPPRQQQLAAPPQRQHQQQAFGNNDVQQAAAAAAAAAVPSADLVGALQRETIMREMMNRNVNLNSVLGLQGGATCAASSGTNGVSGQQLNALNSNLLASLRPDSTNPLLQRLSSLAGATTTNMADPLALWRQQRGLPQLQQQQQGLLGGSAAGAPSANRDLSSRLSSFAGLIPFADQTGAAPAGAGAPSPSGLSGPASGPATVPAPSTSSSQATNLNAAALQERIRVLTAATASHSSNVNFDNPISASNAAAAYGLSSSAAGAPSLSGLLSSLQQQAQAQPQSNPSNQLPFLLALQQQLRSSSADQGPRSALQVPGTSTGTGPNIQVGGIPSSLFSGNAGAVASLANSFQQQMQGGAQSNLGQQLSGGAPFNNSLNANANPINNTTDHTTPQNHANLMALLAASGGAGQNYNLLMRANIGVGDAKAGEVGDPEEEEQRRRREGPCS